MPSRSGCKKRLQMSVTLGCNRPPRSCNRAVAHGNRDTSAWWRSVSGSAPQAKSAACAQLPLPAQPMQQASRDEAGMNRCWRLGCVVCDAAVAGVGRRWQGLEPPGAIQALSRFEPPFHYIMEFDGCAGRSRNLGTGRSGTGPSGHGPHFFMRAFSARTLKWQGCGGFESPL
jgi:hypothetical protein